MAPNDTDDVADADDEPDLDEMRREASRAHGQMAAVAAQAFYNAWTGMNMAQGDRLSLTEAWLRGGMGPQTARTEYVYLPTPDSPLTR